MRRNGSTQPQNAWSNELKGMILETDFTLKGNGIIPMTSQGKRRSVKRKANNNGWVFTSNTKNKMGTKGRRNIKPQTLAEMLAFSRPSTQGGKNLKGFFRNSGGSPKIFKVNNGFLRRQVSHGKMQNPDKPIINHLESTVGLKSSQVTLSPKFKDYYQNQKKMVANLIDVESPVDNLTAASGASNKLAKAVKQPIQNAFKNTQGLQGSIYSVSNSTDIRNKMEKDSQNTKEMQPSEAMGAFDTIPKRAITQSSKVRVNKEGFNRIREAKKKAGTLMLSQGSKAVFQYQFEMQNKEEENCFRDLYDCLNELID
ncbi:unnamed protein product [Moneuplotes crassus]|uniref:Uncharacterized protein n=1 Tax=Euplotes crassus TaxID=5936 RepID=A0AAD1XLZ0_EUPCR|nr:unnamed protein product [Moneuplotes crassus]